MMCMSARGWVSHPCHTLLAVTIDSAPSGRKAHMIVRNIDVNKCNTDVTMKTSRRNRRCLQD